MRPLFARPAVILGTLTALNVLNFTDRFRDGGIREPVTHAVAWAMIPWLLAIPCLFRAAALASRASARESAILRGVTP